MTTELRDGLEAVLRAMATDERSGLPFAANARFTENGQVLKIGDGLWGTLTRFAGDGGSLGDRSDHPPQDYRIDFIDEAAGQAAFFGAIVENKTPGMMMLRVKFAKGEIAEVEAVAVREEIVGDHGGTVTMFQPRLLLPFEPKGFSSPDPALVAPVSSGGAKEQDLIAIAEGFFNAIENDNPELVDFTESAVVRNNGLLAANDQESAPLNPDYPDYRPFALGVKEQIATGFSRYTSRVNHRRHVAVDPARGLVLSVAVFDHNARVHEIDVPGLGKVELPGYVAGKEEEKIAALPGSKIYPNLQVPTSDLYAQLIRVENGRIAYVEAISRGAPYGLSPNW